MEKIILTDCDGVLCNWNNAFREFMSTHNLPQLPNTDHEYNISTRHGISHATAHEYVKLFNESYRIENLEPFADAVEYVSKLSNHGFKFIVVTSISSAPHAHFHRTKNLHRIFGSHVFSEIRCLEMGISKAAELQRWADTGYYWIEDHMRQAEAGYEAGLKTVLINHPYNSHYKTDLFPTVSYTTPWKEIYNMVCTDYKLEC
jgi:beta-phosphoglucomutase-like phosphatase (HAD superfamily)